jgi:hypothetical protein
MEENFSLLRDDLEPAVENKIGIKERNKYIYLAQNIWTNSNGK